MASCVSASASKTLASSSCWPGTIWDFDTLSTRLTRSRWSATTFSAPCFLSLAVSRLSRIARRSCGAIRMSIHPRVCPMRTQRAGDGQGFSVASRNVPGNGERISMIALGLVTT